jgi:nucleoside-diphosphate-sugar epimerase
MGGMGFIQSNHAVIMYNNTMISFNMLEAARINGVSSARIPGYGSRLNFRDYCCSGDATP